MTITSRSNPKIKDILKLYDKKYRKLFNCYLVEGIKPVRECMAAGGEIIDIYCTEKLTDQFEGATLVTESVFSAISDEKSPQGVLAVVKLPENRLIAPEQSCILLDCLQDPGNLGTIVRTANAAGFHDIYLIGCTDPFSPKAVRASMSGVFFTRLHSGTRDEIMDILNGVPLICAELHGDNIFDFVPPEKFCLCIGNEGSGISKEIIQKADHKIRIPMTKSCESLNAAVSAGICMYQLKYKKRG